MTEEFTVRKLAPNCTAEDDSRSLYQMKRHGAVIYSPELGYCVCELCGEKEDITILGINWKCHLCKKHYPNGLSLIDYIAHNVQCLSLDAR